MIKRGDIYYIRDTRQSIGSEQRADRPAVIVSNNVNNKHSGVYEIVYMTTQPKTDLPTHFITQSALRPSTVLCEQINSIYEERIGEWIGTLTPEEMKALDQCLAISIDIKADSGKETESESIRQQLAEAEARQQAAEKQMQIYKEMYEFLLSKQLGARENEQNNTRGIRQLPRRHISGYCNMQNTRECGKSLLMKK